MEQELDINLAIQYAASAANALKAFEWAFQVLARAQSIQAELDIQEKKLVALEAANTSAEQELSDTKNNLKKLQTDATAKARELENKYRARQAEADKAFKEKVDDFAQKEAVLKANLSNLTVSVEEQKKILEAEISLMQDKLKAVQDEYANFLDKIKVV